VGEQGVIERFVYRDLGELAEFRDLAIDQLDQAKNDAGLQFNAEPKSAPPAIMLNTSEPGYGRTDLAGGVRRFLPRRVDRQPGSAHRSEQRRSQQEQLSLR
jgi:hypothetical protein